MILRIAVKLGLVELPHPQFSELINSRIGGELDRLGIKGLKNQLGKLDVFYKGPPHGCVSISGVRSEFYCSIDRIEIKDGQCLAFTTPRAKHFPPELIFAALSETLPQIEAAIQSEMAEKREELTAIDTAQSEWDRLGMSK